MAKDIYIRASGCVSPQASYGSALLAGQPAAYAGNRLRCMEPDYSTIIDPKQARRMSRIIKMGVAAAMECLNNAATQQPDAIITGTAYGCLEDTGVFLAKVLEHNEEMTAPAAFIQSTHNTVGAQIALMLQCRGYNNTFVHRGISFESALADAIMLLRDGDAHDVLLGGIDEVTDTSHGILGRLGLYKPHLGSNLDLYRQNSKGTIAGEGAAFFLLTGKPSANDVARISGAATFYKPENSRAVVENIQSFLDAHSMTMTDIDLVLTGRNGDSAGDLIYDELSTSLFKHKLLSNYKHLCGDYPTSVSFALWLAAGIVKSCRVPASLMENESSTQDIKNVLIYNHSHGIYHSLILVTAI